MGGFLREGKWVTKDNWEKNSKDGSFQRQTSAFRDKIEDREGARFQPEAGRYHLYVSYACPWAHRTLIARALMGLEEVISVSVVNHFMGDDGWTFEPTDGVIPDPIFDATYLREIYVEADPNFSGRVTVPVLWDRKEGTIVNNESREIIRMFSDAFQSLATKEVNLAPQELREEIDAAMDAIYEPINNGVYRCGFAGTQEAYESAYAELFDELDRWEAILGERRYLAGEQLTEADLCMFTTLVRFDPVYFVHFKCSKKHIFQYENLSNYLRELYQLPGVAETVDMEHIRNHYFRSHPNLNPKRFVPPGPIPDLTTAHDRARLPGGPPLALRG